MKTTTCTDAPWAALHEAMGVSEVEYDDRGVGAWVAHYADTIGDRGALRFLDRTYSYAELDRLANQLANALVALGVGRDDVVGLHMPNIPQYAIALVALSRIGCAGSGVSPLLVPAELEHQVSDAGISVIISLRELAQERLTQFNAPACLRDVIVTGALDCVMDVPAEDPVIENVRVSNWAGIMQGTSEAFNAHEPDWNDTSMIQYTGGTTGKPKGAMLSVRNLMCNSQLAGSYMPWEPGEEVLASAFPMFHIAGLSNVLGGLRQGALVMLIPDPRDITHFCQQMLAIPPTRLAAVPTLYQMLLQHPDIDKVDFSGLRSALTGAAPLTGEDRARIDGLIGENKLFDVFGMTETSPVHVMNPPARVKPTSVGIPLPGMETRVVDLETGSQEMPVGEPGEIISRGPQVMKGYLNLPDESAKALREFRGETWMYTGDVGYMDEEGYIYLCDRAKDMLVVSGYKVFSVELEDKLASLPYIAQSAVIGSPDPKRPGSEVVNLFVELLPSDSTPDAEQASADILEFCRTNMSAYKVPRNIQVVPAIPLTPVGKVDKKALRAELLQAQA